MPRRGSQLGVNTRLGGGPAHHFEVTLRLPVGTDEKDTFGKEDGYNPHAESARLYFLAGSIIDREKPATPLTRFRSSCRNSRSSSRNPGTASSPAPRSDSTP